MLHVGENQYWQMRYYEICAESSLGVTARGEMTLQKILKPGQTPLPIAHSHHLCVSAAYLEVDDAVLINFEDDEVQVESASKCYARLFCLEEKMRNW